MEAKFEELVESFITGKIGISESFISEKLSASLLENLLALNSGGLLRIAGIGKDQNRTEAVSIRSDKTKWLDADTKNDAEQEFLELIRRFTEYLNKTCYTGINSCEFHYALYDTGTFYKRHKDQFSNNNSRKYSMISYLNTNWKAEEGGQLIIHHADKDAQNITPNSCKMVFFESSVLEHEVAIAIRPRMSVTGWLKRN